MDAPFIGDEESSLLDIIPNYDAPSTDKSLVEESLRDEISRVLQVLDEREHKVIEAYFGIETRREWTLEEIGE